jgi:hypothetical protein
MYKRHFGKIKDKWKTKKSGDCDDDQEDDDDGDDADEDSNNDDLMIMMVCLKITACSCEYSSKPQLARVNAVDLAYL